MEPNNSNPTNQPSAPIQPAEPLTNPTTGQPSQNNSTATTSTPTVVEQAGSAQSGEPDAGKGWWSNKKIRAAAMAAGVIVILVGAGVAAYFGYYLPNKPENILGKAVVNTMQSRQLGFDATMTLKDTSGKASISSLLLNDLSLTATGHVNADQKNLDAQVGASLNNMKVQAEVKMVDQSAYFKVTGLGTAKDFADSVLPGLGDPFNQLNKQLGDQWIQVDQATLNGWHASCLTTLNYAPSQTDIDRFKSDYKKYGFATIRSHQSEQLGSLSTIKYDVAINDNKLADYLDASKQSSYFANIQNCLAQISRQSSKTSSNSLRDDDTTPLKIWVDKSSKRIVQIEADSTAQDSKNGVAGKLTAKLNYGSVNITKPESSKPFSDIQKSFSDLLSGSAAGSIPVTTILQ
jgi:hypothetical protein